jgi:hypothetical protein
MDNIGVTMIAPKGKVSEAEHDGVILMLFVMRICHVSFHISRASNCSTIWFDANPILATVAAFNTRVINCFVFKVFFCPDIFRSAVWTVSFR